MLEFFKTPFKAQGPTLFLLYIIYNIIYTICNITVYADQESDLWQQLEFASELESNLQDTVD